MGNKLFPKITPQQINNQSKYLILDPANKQDVSRANFRFLHKIMITGHNHEQIIWLAQNIRNPKQKFLIKQIDKLILYDNNRIYSSLKQLELWIQAYKQKKFAALFLTELLFAFQDYQYLYMVFEEIQGYTLDSVLKNHSFNQQQTKYIVAVMIQIMQYFHENKYALTELSPQHFIIQKKSGKLKLMQIFNTMPIDVPYGYNVITYPSVYSAPQVLAKNKVLAESDYYTVGTIMYQMMTQKNGLLDQLIHAEKGQRQYLITQEIEVKKYNLPQGWNPQAADFLVKLLIKNPLYRLGKYGSFQLRFHPWLQNYNWQILATREVISLNQQFFDNEQIKIFPNLAQLQMDETLKTKMLQDYLFINMFKDYYYHQDLQEKARSKKKYKKESELKQQGASQTKKSQKYYDKQQRESEQQQSNQQQQEQQEYDKLQISQQQFEKSEKISKEKSHKASGRGNLLNIVGKYDE